MNPATIAALRAHIAATLAEHPELADDEALRADTLEGATDIDRVIGRLIIGIREDEARGEAMKTLSAEYALRAEADKKRGETRARLIMRLLDTANLTRFRVPEGNASIVPGRPAVNVTDEASLPEWAWKVTRAVSKTQIKAGIEAGQECPGAVISNGAPYLRIT